MVVFLTFPLFFYTSVCPLLVYLFKDADIAGEGDEWEEEDCAAGVEDSEKNIYK